MKTTFESIAYEAPSIAVVMIDAEGVLCESNVGASHEGYVDGGIIEF